MSVPAQPKEASKVAAVVEPSTLSKATTKILQAPLPGQMTIYIGSTTKEPEKDLSIWPTAITATSTVLAAAAWPLGIISLAIIFKTQVGTVIESLASFIKRLKSFKGWGGEVTAEEMVHELIPDPVVPEDAVQEAAIDEVASLDPLNAVVSSWVSVERSLRKLFERVVDDNPIRIINIAKPKNVPVRKMIDYLVKMGIIGHSLSQEIIVLSQVRNRLVHDPDEGLSEEAVRAYVSNASTVLKFLDQAPTIINSSGS
jgi:hypothetical protein